MQRPVANSLACSHDNMLDDQEERTIGKGNMSGKQPGTDLWRGPRAEVQAVGFILKMMFSYRKPLLMLFNKDGMQGGSER